MSKLVVLAGGTGDLGLRIARALRSEGARVRALVRHGAQTEALGALGCELAPVDFADATGLAAACEGGSCVVSSLSGLREVIVGAQSQLLDAAVVAKVPRFVPSDFCIDFTKLPAGTNRNLDLRRDFRRRLDAAPIAASSVFNGAFADMLTGQAPFLLFKLSRALYWERPDQKMDFTTKDDVAAFTARVAMDDSAPRDLTIAGDQVSARELAAVASEVTGRRFTLLRAGSLQTLERIIFALRALAPARGELYPPWQGMQYMHNMFVGTGDTHIDNARYEGLRWSPVREVLSQARA